MSFGGWSPDVGVVFVSLEIMGFLSPRLLGSSLTLDPSRRLVSAVILNLSSSYWHDLFGLHGSQTVMGLVEGSEIFPLFDRICGGFL